MSTGAMLMGYKLPERGGGGGKVPVAWVAGDVKAHPSGHVLSGLLWAYA